MNYFRDQFCISTKQAPCGYLGHPSNKCRCTPDNIIRYQSRVSGPLLDRIDMHIEVGPVPHAVLQSDREGESSRDITARVEAAFKRQLDRQHKSNQQLTPREIDRFCKPDAAGQTVLRNAMLQFHWSARSYHRVLRVARTIADLAGSRTVEQFHVSEAIQLRRGLQQF